MPAPLRHLLHLARRATPDTLKRWVRQWRPRPTTAPDDAAPSWAATAPSPWDGPAPAAARQCNICWWEGPEFDGPAHCEAARCPRCGSIARDRFLFFCAQARMPPALGATVLETSPRLGGEYRRAMSRWFDYTCSDFDEGAHTGMIRVDLQKMELDDSSLDLLLTPHVLEHVPDTGAALSEIRRVLRPGGRMYLQVPVLQGATAPPREPEFHGDDTPVFWRFGYDLTDRLRREGFATSALVTEDWARLVESGAHTWPGDTSPEFDLDDMLAAPGADDVEIVADTAQARRHGFDPAYMFLTWECVLPD